MRSKPGSPACSWCLSIAFKFTPVREKELLNIFPASLKHNFHMLFVPGLAKDQGSPICPHYFGNTLESTQLSGTELNANVLPATTALSSDGFESQQLSHSELLVSRGGCFVYAHRMLQDTAGRGVEVVCAVTTWCQSAFMSPASMSLSELLQAFQQLITANLCPWREQTVHRSHLSPRCTSGWDGSCVHPFLPPSHSGVWSTPTCGRWTHTNMSVCVSVCPHGEGCICLLCSLKIVHA